ncbi:MAG TPA: CoA-binding protein [Acidimicrobiales bacterium]|nr:CoA-binding protein [Acidimicrobiales bacterium]
MTDLRALLEQASTVLLVDWSHQEVPATLTRAGYTVIVHGPDGYTHCDVTATEPSDVTAGTAFPLEDGGWLVGQRLDILPAVIDIVAVYRPADEQSSIAEQAIDLGARTLWIQPGVDTSPDARGIAESAGLTVIDGADIADTVRELQISV